jgi:mRNA interferase RelE/StbE
MYSIRFKKSAQKELSQIPSPFNLKIVQASDALSQEPRPVGVKKLKGEENAWRIRVSDYRIIYTIEVIIQ